MAGLFGAEIEVPGPEKRLLLLLLLLIQKRLLLLLLLLALLCVLSAPRCPPNPGRVSLASLPPRRRAASRSNGPNHLGLSLYTTRACHKKRP